MNKGYRLPTFTPSPICAPILPRVDADGALDDEQLAAAERAYLRVRGAMIAYADALTTIEAADAALEDPVNQQRLDALRTELLRTAADLAAFALVGRETCPLMQP